MIGKYTPTAAGLRRVAAVFPFSKDRPRAELAPDAATEAEPFTYGPGRLWPALCLVPKP